MHSFHRLFAAGLLLLAACRWEHDDAADDEVDAAVEVDAEVADADPMAPDAAPAPDATPESAIIACGASDCPRDTQICCYTNFPNITQMCATADQCVGPSVKAQCDGPEDCSNGDVCCVETTGATCKPDAQCTGATTGKACHTDDDCPGTMNCHMSQFVPWPIC